MNEIVSDFGPKVRVCFGLIIRFKPSALSENYLNCLNFDYDILYLQIQLCRNCNAIEILS